MPANKLHDSATIQTGIHTGMKATLQNRYEFLCVLHSVPLHPRFRAAMFGKLLSMLRFVAKFYKATLTHNLHSKQSASTRRRSSLCPSRAAEHTSN